MVHVGNPHSCPIMCSHRHYALCKRLVQPGLAKPGDWLQVALVRYCWSSLAVDSAYDVHIVNDPKVFYELQNTSAHVCVANSKYVMLEDEGLLMADI